MNKPKNQFNLVNLLLNFYRKIAWLKHQILFSVTGSFYTCNHQPSCSKYTQMQIEKHGTIVGLWKGFLRILTCY